MVNPPGARDAHPDFGVLPEEGLGKQQLQHMTQQPGLLSHLRGKDNLICERQGVVHCLAKRLFHRKIAVSSTPLFSFSWLKNVKNKKTLFETRSISISSGSFICSFGLCGFHRHQQLSAVGRDLVPAANVRHKTCHQTSLALSAPAGGGHHGLASTKHLDQNNKMSHLNPTALSNFCYCLNGDPVHHLPIDQALRCFSHGFQWNASKMGFWWIHKTNKNPQIWTTKKLRENVIQQ